MIHYKGLYEFNMRFDECGSMSVYLTKQYKDREMLPMEHLSIYEV